MRPRVLVGASFLAAAAVAFNNLRPPLGGAAYVGVNLFVGVVIGFLVLVWFKSDAGELGLRGNRPEIVLKSGLASMLLVAPLFVLVMFESSAHWVADDRAAGLSVPAVVWHAVIRIPLGTALFEEFVFRGVLFGIISRRGRMVGAIASSVSFGLWHIRPALGVVDANAHGADAAVVTLWVVAVVFVTSIAGMVFCWLRVKGGGIGAPVAFHAGINSLSLIAAAIAHEQIS
jgi:uncharacterized protein